MLTRQLWPPTYGELCPTYIQYVVMAWPREVWPFLLEYYNLFQFFLSKCWGWHSHPSHMFFNVSSSNRVYSHCLHTMTLRNSTPQDNIKNCRLKPLKPPRPINGLYLERLKELFSWGYLDRPLHNVLLHDFLVLASKPIWSLVPWSILTKLNNSVIVEDYSIHGSYGLTTKSFSCT